MTAIALGPAIVLVCAYLVSVVAYRAGVEKGRNEVNEGLLQGHRTYEQTLIAKNKAQERLIQALRAQAVREISNKVYPRR